MLLWTAEEVKHRGYKAITCVDSRFPHLIEPAELDLFRLMEQKGRLQVLKGHGDRSILSLAVKHDALILSNDLFRDWAELGEWARSNRVGFQAFPPHRVAIALDDLPDRGRT